MSLKEKGVLITQNQQLSTDKDVLFANNNTNQINALKIRTWIQSLLNQTLDVIDSSAINLQNGNGVVIDVVDPENPILKFGNLTEQADLDGNGNGLGYYNMDFYYIDTNFGRIYLSSTIAELQDINNNGFGVYETLVRINKENINNGDITLVETDGSNLDINHTSANGGRIKIIHSNDLEIESADSSLIYNTPQPLQYFEDDNNRIPHYGAVKELVINSGGSGAGITSIVPGNGIFIDATDAQNPIIEQGGTFTTDVSIDGNNKDLSYYGVKDFYLDNSFGYVQVTSNSMTFESYDVTGFSVQGKTARMMSNGLNGIRVEENNLIIEHLEDGGSGGSLNINFRNDLRLDGTNGSMVYANPRLLPYFEDNINRIPHFGIVKQVVDKAKSVKILEYLRTGVIESGTNNSILTRTSNHSIFNYYHTTESLNLKNVSILTGVNTGVNSITIAIYRSTFSAEGSFGSYPTYSEITSYTQLYQNTFTISGANANYAKAIVNLENISIPQYNQLFVVITNVDNSNTSDILVTLELINEN